MGLYGSIQMCSVMEVESLECDRDECQSSPYDRWKIPSRSLWQGKWYSYVSKRSLELGFLFPSLSVPGIFSLENFLKWSIMGTKIRSNIKGLKSEASVGIHHVALKPTRACGNETQSPLCSLIMVRCLQMTFSAVAEEILLTSNCCPLLWVRLFLILRVYQMCIKFSEQTNW